MSPPGASTLCESAFPFPISSRKNAGKYKRISAELVNLSVNLGSVKVHEVFIISPPCKGHRGVSSNQAESSTDSVTCPSDILVSKAWRAKKSDDFKR
jgi:hypothetical protein